MKQYGLLGKGTGKLGSSVFAISGGEQIVREYNPKVSNPNTQLQIEQRAKFKLMSQLASLFAPVLGFSKQGLKSARNQFVKKNIKHAEISGTDMATIDMLAIELTNSAVPATGMRVVYDAQNERGVVILDEPFDQNYDAIVYANAHEVGNRFELFDFGIAKVKDMGTPKEVTIELGDGDNFLYAFGVKYPATDTGVYYLDLNSDEIPDSAVVTVIKSLIASGATFTASKALKATL